MATQEKPRPPRLGMIIALLGALLLASCTGGSVGARKAPDFEIAPYQGASILNGGPPRFSTLLKQGKPVILNFYAGLCPPCRAEMPAIQQVAEQYGDRVTIFGLDIGPFVGLGSSEDGQRLLQQLHITYPAGTTADAAVVRDYQIAGMPTTVFVTPQGTIVRQWTGLLTHDALVANIEELLKASAP